MTDELLVAAPGMTLEAARNASSAPFDVPPDTDERSFAQPGAPHAFRLSHPDHGIDLPEGKFSVLEAHRGVIFRLRVTPHMTSLSLEDAAELARGIGAKLRDAGWQRREERPAATLRERLKDDGEDRAASFIAGEWIAEVWARRIVRAGSEMARLMGKEEDEYVVTLLVWDIRRTAETMG